MTLREKQSLFVQNVVHLINYIYSNGQSCTLGESWRSPEQAQIYAKEGKGIKDSLHCKRLAIDLNLFDKDGNLVESHDAIKPYGTYWKGLHTSNRWGGDFPKLVDSVHFEMQDL
jgi:hypothetical protein